MRAYLDPEMRETVVGTDVARRFRVKKGEQFDIRLIARHGLTPSTLTIEQSQPITLTADIISSKFSPGYLAIGTRGLENDCSGQVVNANGSFFYLLTLYDGDACSRLAVSIEQAETRDMLD